MFCCYYYDYSRVIICLQHEIFSYKTTVNLCVRLLFIRNTFPRLMFINHEHHHYHYHDTDTLVGYFCPYLTTKEVE